MFKALREDVILYRYLIGIQVKAQLQYKINLLFDIAAYLGITALEFTAVILYFQAFPSLLGWKMGEVALLAGIINFSFGLAELFGGGIDKFSESIRRGEFDRVLLRPVSVFMLVVSNEFMLRRFGRMTQGILVFLFGISLLPGLHWTLDKALALLIGVGSTSIIFIAIMMLGATMCFWTIQTTELTNILTDGGREMLNYPVTIYQDMMQRFFLFVVPVAFGSFLPICYLLDRSLPFGLPPTVVWCSPLLACMFATIAAFIWRFGIRHYQSTGS